MYNYILIEVDTNNATFTSGKSNYEIYHLPTECGEINIKNASTVVLVEAKNQAEAFKLFNSVSGIFKRPDKNYYEKMLMV